MHPKITYVYPLFFLNLNILKEIVYIYITKCRIIWDYYEVYLIIFYFLLRVREYMTFYLLSTV